MDGGVRRSGPSENQCLIVLLVFLKFEPVVFSLFFLFFLFPSGVKLAGVTSGQRWSAGSGGLRVSMAGQRSGSVVVSGLEHDRSGKCVSVRVGKYARGRSKRVR